MRTNLDTVKRNLCMGRATMDDLEALVREVESARAAVGAAWFADGVTLAEAIARKCWMLEEDAAKAAAEVKRLQGPSEEPKSEIKRYDTTTVYIGCGEYVGDVEETEDGDYVLFDDHRAIVERIQKDARLGKAVRKAVERMESDHVAGHYRWDGSDEIIIDEGQLDVLRAIDDVLRAEEGGEHG